MKAGKDDEIRFVQRASCFPVKGTNRTEGIREPNALSWSDD